MELIKSLALAGLFIFIGTTTGCTSGYQKTSTKPVAKVNEHILSTKEFASLLARELKNFDAVSAKDPNNVFRLKEKVLRDFIVKSITRDWAQSKGIEISDSELDKEVTKMRENYPDDLSFRRSLAVENMSFSEWREKLRDSMIEAAVFRKISEGVKAPAEQDIQSYYDQNKQRFSVSERILIRQIVVDDEAKADAIKVELKKSDFTEVAKKFSITPEAKDGGLVGWIEKDSVDFFNPLFKVGVNNLHTFKSPYGFHLARVEGKKPAGNRALTEVRSYIVNALNSQKEQALYVAWLDNQIRSSKVLKDYEVINSIKIETRNENE